MRKKCRNCLCRTGTNVCHCHDCKGKIKECRQYNGFQQLSIFEPPEEPKYNKAPRYSWERYGISKKRYKQLTEYIQSGRYASLASQEARRANKMIEPYIMLSLTKNLSYERLRTLWELRKIERMPCGRSDFYGWRRYVIHLLDLELRRIGK